MRKKIQKKIFFKKKKLQNEHFATTFIIFNQVLCVVEGCIDRGGEGGGGGNGLACQGYFHF